MSDRCQTNVLQTVPVCACVSPLAPDMAGCSGTRCWFPTGFQVSTAVLSGAHLLLLVLWSVVWWRVGALVWAGLDVTSYIGTRGRGSGLVQAYIYIYTHIIIHEWRCSRLPQIGRRIHSLTACRSSWQRKHWPFAVGEAACGGRHPLVLCVAAFSMAEDELRGCVGADLGRAACLRARENARDLVARLPGPPECINSNKLTPPIKKH